MSLRNRLVLTVVGLLALGLLVSVGAILGALQDWVGDNNGGDNTRGDKNGGGNSAEAAAELLHRVTVVSIFSSLAALLLVGAASWHILRRGLRPLEKIADTAVGIDSTDLAQRVHTTAAPATEVGQLAASLNTMLGRIETAFAQKAASEERLRRFVADASHELRTPVATIRGYAELFRRGASARPDDLAMAMARIEEEAQRMGVLVDELLLLARLDQDRPLTFERVCLTQLAAQSMADTKALGTGHQWELRPDSPVWVKGDPDRLRQVFGNLLSNVVAHTPESTQASVAVTLDQKKAVIQVVDNGPGVAESERIHILERFVRTHSSDHSPRPTEQGGAGLGLAIVAAIVEAHHGRIEVLETPGGGCTVKIELPTTAEREDLLPAKLRSSPAHRSP